MFKFRSYLVLALISIWMMSGCGDEDGGSTDSGTQGETGAATFYVDFNQCGQESLDFCVNLDGKRSCSSPQTSPPTDCTSSAGAFFQNLAVGSHGYSATVEAGNVDQSWSGSVTVRAGECEVVQLRCN